MNAVGKTLKGPPESLPNSVYTPASPDFECRGTMHGIASPHGYAAAAAAKSLQSCPTLCDPIDGSLLGYSVPGILQARTLEWVAILILSAEMKGLYSNQISLTSH